MTRAAFVGTSTVSGLGSSLTIDAPAGIQSGDHQLIIVVSGTGGGSYPTISGFTRDGEFSGSGSGDDSSWRVSVHLASNSSETGSINVTNPNDGRLCTIARAAWRGGDGWLSSPAPSGTSRASSTSHALPSQGTTAAEQVVVGVIAYDTGDGADLPTVFSMPSPWNDLIPSNEVSYGEGFETQSIQIFEIERSSSGTQSGTVTADREDASFVFSATLAAAAAIGDPPTINAGGDVVDWPINTQFNRAAIVDDGGLTTTVEWKITSGPTGVGSTIDDDETLNWIPTQTGSYTIEATATNSAGSDSDSFVIEVIGATSDTLRFYMTSTDLATNITLPNEASYWDVLTLEGLNDCHQLSTVPEGPAEFRGLVEATADQPIFGMIGRWVSGPATSSGTLLDEEVNFVMARGESAADADMVWAIGVRVITAEGTVRGEHFGVFFSTEWPVVADATEAVASSAVVSTGNITSVSVQTGDRVMLEVGFRTTNTTADDRAGYVIFGGTSSPDLAPGDAGGNLSRPSWIELPISSGLSFSNEAAPEIPAGAPGQVYDLSEWHLTTPRDSGGGDAEQIDQPELETFELPESGGNTWYVNESAEIVASADVNGFTTSGESGATRMEARQRTPGYGLMAFDPYTDSQRMTMICYPDARGITGGSNPREQMIFWQIHGDSGSPPLLFDCDHNSVSQPRIRLYKDGPGDSDPIRPYNAGDPIGVRCIVENGQIDLWVRITDNPDDLVGDFNDQTFGRHYTFQASDFVDDANWYFKWGAYNKTTISSGSTGRSVNRIAYLELNNVVLGPNAVTPPDEDPFPQMAFFFGGM